MFILCHMFAYFHLLQDILRRVLCVHTRKWIRILNYEKFSLGTERKRTVIIVSKLQLEIRKHEAWNFVSSLLLTDLNSNSCSHYDNSHQLQNILPFLPRGILRLKQEEGYTYSFTILYTPLALMLIY
jgi:hypothetical protein